MLFTYPTLNWLLLFQALQIKMAPILLQLLLVSTTTTMAASPPNPVDVPFQTMCPLGLLIISSTLMEEMMFSFLLTKGQVLGKEQVMLGILAIYLFIFIAFISDVAASHGLCLVDFKFISIFQVRTSVH